MKKTTSLLTFIFIFLNGLTAIGQMSPELRAKLIARAAVFRLPLWGF